MGLEPTTSTVRLVRRATHCYTLLYDICNSTIQHQDTFINMSNHNSDQLIYTNMHYHTSILTLLMVYIVFIYYYSKNTLGHLYNFLIIRLHILYCYMHILEYFCKYDNHSTDLLLFHIATFSIFHVLSCVQVMYICYISNDELYINA